MKANWPVQRSVVAPALATARSVVAAGAAEAMSANALYRSTAALLSVVTRVVGAAGLVV